MPIPVLGSEKFEYKPVNSSELRAAAGGGLQLHDVPEGAAAEIDPLTYEVIRGRLWAITEEMGEAVKRMSGSLVVTQCNDFDIAIMDECGDVVQVGLYNTEMCASMDMSAKWTIQHRSANPGIADGDMFITTDPWVGGGIHQNDASLMAPLFWEGDLFCWTSTCAHQIDLGGVAPGSWTPRSEDVFWESIPMPPIKLVERGQVRSDVEDAYLRRSRVPMLVALDSRAMIGANNVGHEQLRRLIGKYGPDTVKAAMRRMLDDAERRLRAKLRDIPDGTWKAIAHQDQARSDDRGIYKIVVSMTKADDHLTFDFTGTDPEVDGLINCTYAGIRGGVVPPLLTTLCGDIPWAAGGINRCYDIVSEPGTINNCRFPAGISKASVASCWATANAVAECIAGMLDASPKYRELLMADSCGTWDLAFFAGVDQREQPFATMLGDPMAGGLGARSDQDGVDTGGLAVIAMGAIADVEMNEFAYPLLYLWRREEPDTGGPGRYRGGMGASSCFVPHDSPADAMAMVVSHTGKALPQAAGVSGGYPANTAYDVVVRGSAVAAEFAAGRVPENLDQLGGEQESVPPEFEGMLANGDVYYTRWQGGGGYGDPLDREPAAVFADLEAEKVTEAGAEGVYGVVVAAGGVDNDATAKRRDEIRTRRGGGGAPRPARLVDDGDGGTAIDGNVEVVDDGSVHCRHCGSVAGVDAEDPYSEALTFEGPPSTAGPHILEDGQQFVDRDIVFRQLCCPGCRAALLTEVVPADEPSARGKSLSLRGGR